MRFLICKDELLIVCLVRGLYMPSQTYNQPGRAKESYLVFLVVSWSMSDISFTSSALAL